MATALSPQLVYGGIPHSDTKQPDPVEIIALLNAILSGISGAQGGLVGFADKATMDADLAHDAGTLALVYNNATVANNTTYVKSGASGTGSWTAIPQIAEKYIVLTNDNSGDGDAITLSSVLALPSVAYGGKFLSHIIDANTGAVTVSINGGAAKSLVTNSGDALSADYLTAGMVIEFVDDGTNYRLTSDVASSAIQAAAEAAQAAAEAAASASSQRFIRVRAVDTAEGAPATDYEAGDAIDGVTLIAGDLVLRATDGGDASDGVYLVPGSGAAPRFTLFDEYDDLPGSYFSVMEGSSNADTLWRCISDTGGTLETTPVVIEEFTSGGTGLASVSTRTAMKALDSALVPDIYLTEAVRVGLFKWDASDLSSLLANRSVTSTAVASDTFTVANHAFWTGRHAVIATTADNGLSTTQLYWVIRVDEDNFKLAASRADALADTEVTLSGTTNMTFKQATDPFEGLFVIRTGDALDGSDGAYRRVIPAGNLINPYMFGGSLDETADAYDAVQAMFDLVRRTYIVASFSYRYTLDFAGRFWRCETSVDGTLFRSPGLALQNGGIHAACLNKVGLDLAGSNQVTIAPNFGIYGDATDSPDIGILLSRCEFPAGSATFPASGNMRLDGVKCEGYYRRAAVVNFASEVSSMRGAHLYNRYKSATASTLLMIDHASVFGATVTGALTSDYVTLPGVSDGNFSNICHDLGQIRLLRPSAFVLPIVSISKANPAVVTLQAGAVASAGLVNGDQVFFNDVAGMTELNKNTYTVANISGDTFELSGVNSTAYGTFTSGNLYSRTGVPLIMSGVAECVGHSGYILCYGNRAIEFNHVYGAGIYDVRLSFQLEANPISACIIRVPTAAGQKNMRGVELRLLNGNQVVRDAFIVANNGGGSGTVRMDNCKIEVMSMTTSDANLFLSQALINWVNGEISIPLAAKMPGVGTFASFSGIVKTGDNAEINTHGLIVN